MILIGFSGKKRHGKDAAADAIIHARGLGAKSAYHRIPVINQLMPPVHNIQKFGFGDLVRDEVEFHCPGTSNRKIWQNWGASKREIHPDYWIFKMDAIVLRARPDVALITGVRFNNEMEWLKSYGGYLIHVCRIGFVDPEPGTDDVTEQFDGNQADLILSVWDQGVSSLRELAVDAFDEMMKKYMGGM